jgi:hypothetical protein
MRAEGGRHRFVHDGNLIYEWEQSIDEVNIYIKPPPDLPKAKLNIQISHSHLIVGIKDLNPFIDEGKPLSLLN